MRLQVLLLMSEQEVASKDRTEILNKYDYVLVKDLF